MSPPCYQAHPARRERRETSGLTMDQSGNPETTSNALPAPSQTFMASHVEVSNGFVKNGTSLPYVIETNKSGKDKNSQSGSSLILLYSGNKKRSSKILPVCGICGKKFVCVTTMKRHLVTHTGERPFNCKVCGKQYTQKGNLRVSLSLFLCLMKYFNFFISGS